jgi:lysine 2,3-aminomutase
MTALCEVPTTVTTVSEAVARAGHQPYEYTRRELVEPDWRRFPGWRDVTETQWRGRTA